MDYAQSVREACKKYGMPITKLESLCGFTQGTIHRWRKVTPQIDKFMKVSEVLGCSIDELCGRPFDDDEIAHPDLVENFIKEMQNQSPDEGMLIQAYRLIPTEHRIEAIDAVLQLKNKYYKL